MTFCMKKSINVKTANLLKKAIHIKNFRSENLYSQLVTTCDLFTSNMTSQGEYNIHETNNK